MSRVLVLALAGLLATPSQAKVSSGVYPVYDFPEGWVLFDRGGRPRELAAGSPVIVVGSKAAAAFSIGRSTAALGACADGRPSRAAAYFLRGRGLERVGTPLVAIRVPTGRAPDLRRARVSRLANEVSDATYRELDAPLRQAALADLRAGGFRFGPDDSLGAHYAEHPQAEKILLKLDFGAGVRLAGAADAFVLVESESVSRSARRCVRLLEEGRPLGGCAEMPHELRAETQSLQFVSYEPDGAGRPFLLAYTPGEPLWGRERWGFQLARTGARRFLMDALDPKCRERF